MRGKRQSKNYLNDSYSESDEKLPVMMIQYKCNMFHVVFVSHFIKMMSKVAEFDATNGCALRCLKYVQIFHWMPYFISFGWRFEYVSFISLLRNHFHIRNVQTVNNGQWENIMRSLWQTSSNINFKFTTSAHNLTVKINRLFHRGIVRLWPFQKLCFFVHFL